MKAASILLMSIFSLLITSCRETRYNANTEWTKAKAEEWVKRNEWRQGFKAALHPSTDLVAFARQYHKNPALWKAAFQYMANTKFDTLPPRVYNIAGEVLYANVTEAPSKTMEESTWEAHQKYIDLQYVIKGREKIGVAPLQSGIITKAYNADRDIMNLHMEGLYHLAEPSVFFLFFPNDAHRPNVKVDGYDVVKKVVVKIAVQD